MNYQNYLAKEYASYYGPDFTLINIQDYPEWAQLLIFFVATDFIQWVTHVILHRFNI